MKKILAVLGLMAMMSMPAYCSAEYEGDDSNNSRNEYIDSKDMPTPQQSEAAVNESAASQAHDAMSQANEVLAQGISNELADEDALVEQQLDAYFAARLAAGIDSDDEDDDPANYIDVHSQGGYARSQ